MHVLNSSLEDVLREIFKIGLTSLAGNITAYLNFCCSRQLTCNFKRCNNKPVVEILRICREVAHFETGD